MNGIAQILEAIKSDNSNIGYVGAGYVLHGGSREIKVLSIYTEKNSLAISPLDAVMIHKMNILFSALCFSITSRNPTNELMSAVSA